MTFTSLALSEPILRSLSEEGYTKPTPIQSQSIPVVLEGRDLLGAAQTGTGKTAAFAIPILQLLSSETDNSGPHPPPGKMVRQDNKLIRRSAANQTNMSEA
jgi:ATP-dependent RNA helicase RhlE